MVLATVELLRRRGIDASLIARDSRAIPPGLIGRASVFFSGVYSRAAAARMREWIGRERPDLIHVHNLHPQFSPSVILAAKQAGVPVVMTCHNYRLVCPSGMHMREGKICERCLGGREYWCLLTRCKGSLLESAGYALRNYVHRVRGYYRDGVDCFIAVSEFVRGRLADAGLPEERITVVPNMVELPAKVTDPTQGEYVAFAGRFTPQKGIATLIKAARLCGLPLRLAGDPAPMNELLAGAPPNVQCIGVLERERLAEFYRGARLAVVPSECLEPFGLVAIEAMSHARPVIASRIGGLPEIVEHGLTGLLFQPGRATELATLMKRLWNDHGRLRSMGRAGRAKAAREYTEERYFERLMKVYESVLARGKSGSGVSLSANTIERTGEESCACPSSSAPAEPPVEPTTETQSIPTSIAS